MTLHYENCGIFFIMGYAGFISSTVLTWLSRVVQGLYKDLNSFDALLARSFNGHSQPAVDPCCDRMLSGLKFWRVQQGMFGSA